MPLSSSQHAKRQTIRQQLRRQRAALTRSQQQHAAWRMAMQLKQHPAIVKAKHVGLYLPHGGEIDPWQFRHHWQDGKHLYLPVLPPDRGHRLHFLEASGPWTHNHFGIIEPAYREDKKRPVHQLDVLLMPLVAFDRQGNRLGMGGGYYDATLAALPAWSKRPICLGIAHSFQEIDNLPSADWDWPLDGVVTD